MMCRIPPEHGGHGGVPEPGGEAGRGHPPQLERGYSHQTGPNIAHVRNVPIHNVRKRYLEELNNVLSVFLAMCIFSSTLRL
jgi:hypothetical protein